MTNFSKGAQQQTQKEGSPSRPRGRPAKEKGDAATDAQRARVRHAQRAFRERKERHVKVLENKVSELERVIEHMSIRFLEFSDALLKCRQVDPVYIKQTMEVFLDLSKCASRAFDEGSDASGGEQDWGDESLSSWMTSTPETKMLQRTPKTASLYREPPASELLTSAQQKRNDPDHIVVGKRYNAGSMVPDPYRNYLWGSPLNSSTDGTSALPYILAGRDSFASRLYFETIVMAVRALQGEGFRSIADSMFPWKRRYAKFEHILGVTSGVLNMMLHGTSQDPKEGHQATRIAELDGPEESTMKAAIAKEVTSQGSSEREYLNTWNVERYLRDKWGLVVSSATVRAPPRALEAPSTHFSQVNETIESVFPGLSGIPFAPTMVPGFAHSEPSLLDARVLVERIKLGAVSLGEGPRWHFSFADDVVQSFLQDHSSRLGIPTYWEVNFPSIAGSKSAQNFFVKACGAIKLAGEFKCMN